MLEEFDYQTYLGLVTRLTRGRRAITFEELGGEAAKEPFVLLRHDIDFSPVAALRMARAEAAAGLSATYFLLFSSPFYNLYSAEHVGLAADLVSLGHEVGLHYDVATYAARSQDADRVLHSELAALGELSGRPVCSVAMHNPSVSGDDPFTDVSGLVNAYQLPVPGSVDYLSDSAGGWRDESIRRVEEDDLGAQVQLLTHPIFWAEAHRSRWECIDELWADHRTSLAVTIEETKALWRGHQGAHEHDLRQSG